MAAAVSEGMGLRACLERGAADGSLACQYLGAQVSAPLRAQVEAFLGNPARAFHGLIEAYPAFAK
jgi:sugar/nucleoside kinase (ribokinase family)